MKDILPDSHHVSQCNVTPKNKTMAEKILVRNQTVAKVNQDMVLLIDDHILNCSKKKIVD